MRTRPGLCFREMDMKPEYVCAAAAEMARSNERCPIDFGALDAPAVFAAGSHYSYLPITPGVPPMTMPTVFWRE